jgi:2-polyprenyl-6-methoxyphenol hydroxylase-like FAD-dependent oxidoreductase
MVAPARSRVTSRPDVLVAGAGPTGLALALMAHDHGARVRIVDRRPEALRPSRAFIVHARTLEVLRPLGVTSALLARADPAPEVSIHLGSRVARIRLADLELPDTAFPHLTLVRQMDVETVLAAALADRGVQVERGVELVAASEGADHARVTLRSPERVEATCCGFVAGCDGPDSAVRTGAGIEWRGGPYGEEVVLADVELDGELAAGFSHVAVGRRGLVFVFAGGERATWRVLATRRASDRLLPFGQPGPPVAAAELQALMDAAGLDVRIRVLAWSARVRLQHRLAARFRRGRLFLAGDAAHTHSPAAGQGMNGGIQDAANLGWKLAFAASASAAGSPADRAALIDSYDLERRPVARMVLAMTHVAFWGEASTGPLASLLRGALGRCGAPAVEALVGRRRLLAEGVRLVSQLRVGYGGSPLSVEGTPRLPHPPGPGSRLPDATVTAEGREVRLHELIARPGVHVLLHRDAGAIERLGFGPGVVLHRLTSAPGDGLLAVRPDGYVGFRCGTADVSQLRAWLARAGACSPGG